MIRPLRAVVLEAHLDASPADVWHALTNARTLADWFARTATAQEGVGGIVEVGWDGASTWPTTIEVWEPERHLRWANTLPPGPDGQPQPRILVDWFISTENGQTVLRLVHSGFGEDAKWDDQIDGTAGGWRYFLWNLEEILVRHRGRHRTMVWSRPRVSGTREALWNAVFDGGLVASDAESSAGGQRCVLALDHETPGLVTISERPYRFAARFPDLDDALLFIEFEGPGPTFHAGFWLSTYGLPPDRVDVLQHALSGGVDECVRRVGAETVPVTPTAR